MTVRTEGASVPLEEVEYLPECSTHDTPESLLMEAEERASIAWRARALARLAREDKRLSIAYRMTAMDRPLTATYVASMLGMTPADAADLIASANARHAAIVAELRRAGS